MPPPGDRNTSDAIAGVPPPARDFPPRIGKYQVLAEIGGRTGQARVFRAYHPDLDRNVAIKLSHEPVAAGTGERDLLVREAQTLASLDHPGLPRVYDVDFWDDRPFLVLELLEGRTLDQIAHDHPLTPRRAARIVAQVGRTLAYLHKEGVVHRDVKPSNIFIDDDGKPRLIDLGLALVRDSQRNDHCEEGQGVGTPRFLPPEQARGDAQAIGPRSDVFALGAVLFWLLTGRGPYERAEGAAAPAHRAWRRVVEECIARLDPAREEFARALQGDIDWTPIDRPGIPSTLRWLCRRAMDPDPSARYATALTFAKQLERFVRRPAMLKACFAAAAVAFAVVLGFILAPVGGDRSASPSETDAHGLVAYQFGRGKFPLSAPPLESGDSLTLEWLVPKDLEPSLFWIDAEGKVFPQTVGVLETTEAGARVRYPADPTKFQEVIGAAGTEVLILCARRGQAASEAEIREALGAPSPWPVLPESTLLKFDKGRVWMETPPGAASTASTRSPGRQVPAPEAARVRADDFRRRLAERFDFISGVAFPHVR
jgi:hypothetical protein